MVDTRLLSGEHSNQEVDHLSKSRELAQGITKPGHSTTYMRDTSCHYFCHYVSRGELAPLWRERPVHVTCMFSFIVVSLLNCLLSRSSSQLIVFFSVFLFNIVIILFYSNLFCYIMTSSSSSSLWLGCLWPKHLSTCISHLKNYKIWL